MKNNRWQIGAHVWVLRREQPGLPDIGLDAAHGGPDSLDAREVVEIPPNKPLDPTAEAAAGQRQRWAR